jgi:catechol 2,3-dioxygenase-like lactoylglutathione lyase family enzyme
VRDVDEAISFYVDKLGFTKAEDRSLGDYRWVLVRPPDTRDVGINLDLARTPEEPTLVGKQAGGQPLFALETDDCLRDYRELKARGVRFEAAPEIRPYGTGVTMQDLYGNRIFLNEEPS